MQYPPPQTTSSSSTSTYTTIPISGGDVIYRSIQNASSFVCSHRPWSELIAAGEFDRPESLTSAGNRIRKNAKYFGINYGIVIVTSTTLSLMVLGSPPLSIILLGFIFGLWLVLYFFREDPLVLKGHQVNDRVVLLSLVLASLMSIWFMGLVGNLLLGFGFGFIILSIHGVFRNPEGLFLDEEEASSRGLIRSRHSTTTTPSSPSGFLKANFNN